MNISDVWMRLEALAHLRGLPQYAAIRKQIENDLAGYNASLTAPLPAPASIPAPEESTS